MPPLADLATGEAKWAVSVLLLVPCSVITVSLCDSVSCSWRTESPLVSERRVGSGSFAPSFQFWVLCSFFNFPHPVFLKNPMTKQWLEVHVQLLYSTGYIFPHDGQLGTKTSILVVMNKRSSLSEEMKVRVMLWILLKSSPIFVWIFQSGFKVLKADEETFLKQSKAASMAGRIRAPGPAPRLSTSAYFGCHSTANNANNADEQNSLPRHGGGQLSALNKRVHVAFQWKSGRFW